MAERVVHFSDLSDQVIPEAAIVTVNVLEHPDIEEPVKLEVTEEEIGGIGKLAMTPVVVEVSRPDEEPERHYFTVANFGKLATDRAMGEVLKGAAPVTPEPRKGNGNNTRDYGTLELAGNPHKGKVSPAEAQLVRENLEEVNARLVADGKRPIDPENVDHRRRYGFDGGPAEAQLSLVTEHKA